LRREWKLRLGCRVWNGGKLEELEEWEEMEY
jgi:hypothetical protein